MLSMAANSRDHARTETFLPNRAAFATFLEEHPHEAAEVAFLQSILQPGMTAIDVGAGVGVTAMAMAREVGKTGSVYAFEPLPRYYAMLQQNLSLNRLRNVTALQAALIDKVGPIDFYDKERSSGIVFDPGAQKLHVASTTIDQFMSARRFQGVDVVAMDCEGSELLVLKGAEFSLRANSLNLFCELHHAFLRQLGHSAEDIVDYLRDVGYEVQGICPNGLQMELCRDSPQYLYAHK